MGINESLESSMAKLQDKRVCRAYYNILFSQGFQLPSIANFDNTKDCYTVLNDIVKNHAPDADQGERRIKQLKLAAQEGLIPLSDFAWLTANEHACYWAWGYIRTASLSMLENPYAAQWRQNETLRYDQLKLNDSPIDTKHRYNLIIDFFDMVIVDLNKKMQLLKHLEKEWQQIATRSKPFKWLNLNDDEQTEWVWKYIFEAQHTNIFTKYGIQMYPQIPTSYLKPINISERKLAIFAAINLWNPHPDTKTLFFRNINKAFSQKKYREKMEDKIPFNTYLIKETKVKLDELARYQDKKIIDIIEKLINDAHTEMKSNQ